MLRDFDQTGINIQIIALNYTHPNTDRNCTALCPQVLLLLLLLLLFILFFLTLGTYRYNRGWVPPIIPREMKN